MVDISHNIGDLVSDVENVKRDMQKIPIRYLRRAMLHVAQEARVYVQDDPNYTGDLLNTIETQTETEGTEQSSRVIAGGPRAPYAGIVEFGSGDLRETAWGGATSIPHEWGNRGSHYPAGYPYSAPDMPKKGPKFDAFVSYIARWMEEKPVPPQKGSIYASAKAIAKAIIDRGNYAHPYLRPAWFRNKRRTIEAVKAGIRQVTT